MYNLKGHKFPFDTDDFFFLELVTVSILKVQLQGSLQPVYLSKRLPK